MTIEKVSERPLFPALFSPTDAGVQGWSTDLIRQLVTVFQQYGFRLNAALLEEQLAANGGNIVEQDQASDFAVMPQFSGSDFLQQGSGPNGGFIVLFGLIQVCHFKRLTLPFEASAGCEATWTFPRAFASTTTLVVLPGATGAADGTAANAYAANATPSTQMIGEYSIGNLSTTSVDVRVERQQGQTDFQAGDEMFASVLAIGLPS